MHDPLARCQLLPTNRPPSTPAVCGVGLCSAVAGTPNTFRMDSVCATVIARGVPHASACPCKKKHDQDASTGATPPASSSRTLRRVRYSTWLATRRLAPSRTAILPTHQHVLVDEASEESFPTSDPPIREHWRLYELPNIVSHHPARAHFVRLCVEDHRRALWKTVGRGENHRRRAAADRERSHQKRDRGKPVAASRRGGGRLVALLRPARADRHAYAHDLL